MDENIPEILFGSSTATPIDGSEHEGGPYDNSEDNDSTSDKEPEFEDEALGQQEPHQQSFSQGIPAQREPTPSPSNRSKQPTEKKKKPKSFQELVQDIQEQNRVLMEKKFAMQEAHQSEKLLFLREESKEKFEFMRNELQQKFSLESRRLDLEYLRMEHQSQESRNKKLALQLQLGNNDKMHETGKSLYKLSWRSYVAVHSFCTEYPGKSTCY